jgi:hypothetical protein
MVIWHHIKVSSTICRSLELGHVQVGKRRYSTNCMALHNFIRDSKMADELFDRCDQDEEYMPIPSCPHASGLGEEEGAMNNFRDQIANALFVRRM